MSPIAQYACQGVAFSVLLLLAVWGLKILLVSEGNPRDGYVSREDFMGEVIRQEMDGRR